MLYNKLSGLEPVNEAYFGKTKFLIKAAAALDRALKRMHKMGLDKTFQINWSHDKDIKEAAKWYEQEFGFRMNLFFDNTPIPNGYTTPPSMGFINRIATGGNDMPKLPLKDNRYYDSSHKYLCTVVIFTTLAYSMDDGDELCAIILHEIGHNFDNSVVTYAYKAFCLYEFLSGKNFIQHVIGELAPYWYWIKGQIFTAVISKIPHLGALLHKCMELMIQYQDALFIPIIIARIQHDDLFGMIFKTFTDPMHQLTLFFGAGREVYADSFATAYGYGPALHRAFVSLEKNYRHNENNLYGADIPLLHISFDLASAWQSVLCALCDEHPSDIYRAISSRDKLEKDLNDPRTPPEVKKSLKRDLKEVNEVIKYMTSDDKIKNQEYFTWFYNNLAVKTDGYIEVRNRLVSLIPTVKV